MYAPDFVDIIAIQHSNFNIWLGVRSHIHFSQEKQERMKAGKISDPILGDEWKQDGLKTNWFLLFHLLPLTGR